MPVDGVNAVAVVGAGTMGPGMAATFARYGYDTRLTDVSAEQLEQAEGTIDFVYSTLVRGGFMEADAVEDAKSRITITGDLEAALAGAQFVNETVPERYEIKREVFTKLDEMAEPGAILASNTSGIPITKLQDGLTNAPRVIGMHWSNPPHVIPVIEVIKGAQTDQPTTDATVAMIESVGMVPGIVDKDIAGFVENRILYAIMREALHLLDEGVASAEDIDKITKWGIGYKLSVIGPLELLDVAGLDIYTAVASYLNQELSNETGISSTVTSKVEEGKLGLKTQGGLFEYTPEQIQELTQTRGRLLLAAKKALTS